METSIDAGLIEQSNTDAQGDLDADYKALGDHLARRDVDIDALTATVQGFSVAVPSWGVGAEAGRFPRFPRPGEPRNIFERLADCAVIQQLVRATPKVSPHFPRDRVDDYQALLETATALGLTFDVVNSNTFQDQPGQALSYHYGSLSHTEMAVREQAVAHNLDCVEIGRKLGSKAITVWIADGADLPGQQSHSCAFARYLESLSWICDALPDDWQVLLEHRLCEPAHYATVVSDWGSSLVAACSLGPKAKCMLSLGDHARDDNIEQIIARLTHVQKLAGVHFNDSKYGGGDLDSGSINPFQLFLVFHELVTAEVQQRPGFNPAHMMGRSHISSDPIESLMMSVIACQRAYAQAHLVDRSRLMMLQSSNDALMAHDTLKQAYQTDVSPILAMARLRSGGCIDPISAYRESGYRRQKHKERPHNTEGHV